ncbi:MAG: OsmC family protein [Vicingaceae bacterium]
MNNGEYLTVKVGKENYTATVSVRNHTFYGDEPESVGGNNNGPNPYEFLLAALGTCTAMTVKMYANRKDWPLEEVVVHLSQSKEYAKDCLECEKATAKIDVIQKKIEFIGDLSEEQKKRLLEIAGKCPVHKTLTGEINIESTLAE